jgi:hypothetical protein
MIRKNYFRIVFALIGVAASGMVARGSIVDQLQINVPFEFVVSGKTLPAGNYTVNRSSQLIGGPLVLSSIENRASAFALPVQHENIESNTASLNFEEVGGHYILSQIKTADYLYTFPVPHSADMGSTMHSHKGTPALIKLTASK